MMTFIARRLALVLFTLLLITLLMFALGHSFPGDPLTNLSGIRDPQSLAYQSAALSYHLDAPWWQRYGVYLGLLLQGQWGQSLVTQQPVLHGLLPVLGATVELSLLAMLLAWVLGVPLGMLAATRQRSWFDRMIMGVSLSAYSVPPFWLAQLALLWFSVQLGWAPISGQLHPLYDITPVTGAVLVDITISDSPERWPALLNALQHLWLPVMVLAILPLTMLIRITRNAGLDVLSQNYIRAARARGLSDWRIWWRHRLPNTMQPVVRQLGLQFSLLMSNVIMIEAIFNWPGLGNWLIKSIYERDYPVMLAGLFSFAALIVLVHTWISIYHALRYPQVRKELYAER